MKNSARLAAAAGVAAVTTTFLAGTSLAATQPHAGGPHNGPQGVVFAANDAVTGNAIAVYDRSADGTLQAAGTYQTGGLGGALTGAVVDHLASQGSLAYDRDRGLLYAVNAGSDTVTVFAVAGDRLIRRQVISSGGTFPVSIAVHGSRLYVLNARDGGSVQGFIRVGDALVRIPAWHRDLGLDPAAAPEFTHTPGQVAVTPDGAKLIVTTKGNGSDIDVFSLSPSGRPSATPVVNADAGNVPFAVSFDAGGHLVVAEAGSNAVATFTINHDGTVTLVDRAATGQAATCWIAADGPAFYASNAGSGTLSGYTDDGSGTLQAAGTTAAGPGTVDAAVSGDGRYLYVQAGATGAVGEFRVSPGGALTSIGSVTVPGAAGGEGIAAG
jgi:6-phosphogluconolactonase (cycloisomerase 2 family)